ncbi:hypothetical protein CupriaWKF_00080 [Cupriavidus sp. WKF15]|uniref:hypothetical protein n=1 Tax=Cupriavidus sp. WKF15 TaxID=3032282 RepID=UPI0023E28A7D|nr:hypothetical protein [Cupriavidus sp. WKF15]WER46029.1 hypothetical protein CupriaWKF_00080 [Cupriavidus sp. WKF15]
MTDRVIPGDFPREQGPAVVSGAQPKLALRRVDGTYYAGLTEEELWERYDICEDLARQLAGYAARKMAEHGWLLDDAMSRVEKSVTKKVSMRTWEFSPTEITWTMKRTRELLSGPGPASSDGSQ